MIVGGLLAHASCLRMLRLGARGSYTLLVIGSFWSIMCSLVKGGGSERSIQICLMAATGPQEEKLLSRSGRSTLPLPPRPSSCSAPSTPVTVEKTLKRSTSLTPPPARKRARTAVKKAAGESVKMTDPSPDRKRHREEARNHPQKEERKRRRQALYAGESEQLKKKGRSVLEERSVQDPARKNYMVVLAFFAMYLRGVTLEKATPSEVDSAAVEYMEESFLDGEPASCGSTLMAALGWARPAFQGVGRQLLPRSSVALKGFRKLSPAHSRLPLPLVVAAGLAMQLAAMGELSLALGTMLAFHLYLRPGETQRMRWRHWSRPMGRRRGGSDGWCLALFPSEEGVPSKTLEFDDTVSIEAGFDYLNKAVQMGYDKAKKNGRLDDLVCQPVKHRSAAVAFAKAAEQLGLQPRPVPHQLRHGGASYDVAVAKKPLLEVKRRGRWMSDRSLRRYEKSGMINQQLSRLSSHVLEFCEASSTKIGDALTLSCQPFSVPSAKASP